MRVVSLTVGLGLLCMPVLAAGQSPSANASLVPPSSFAASTMTSSVPGSGLFICEGWARSPDSWYTTSAQLRLVLAGQTISTTTFSAGYLGDTFTISQVIQPASADRLLTCDITVTVENCSECGSGGDSDSLTLPASCGDERDNIIEEYRAAQVAFTPSCSDLSNTGGSAHFTWNELNGGFSDGNPHNPWGMVKLGLTAGLEATRSSYNRGGIRLASGYRCPHGNDQVGGVQQSFHMHGRAADMYSTDYAWTETEFNLLRQAALGTGPVEALNWNTYSDHHFHAAW